MAQIRRSDTPLAHLIQATDHHMDGPGLMKFPWTHGPATVDLVYGPWTYSTEFSIENNSVIKENSPALVILQKQTWTFQNYVLVPKNLHIHPYIIFYIYN
jgi:hypothetical protein